MSSPMGPFTRFPSPTPGPSPSPAPPMQGGNNPPKAGTPGTGNLINKLLLSPTNKSIAEMSPDEYRSALTQYHQEIKATEENLRNLQKALNPMRFVQQLMGKLKS